MQKKSFDSIPVEDVISWNSIVAVYADNGLLFDAFKLFSIMQFWGKRLSIRSFVGFLNWSSGSNNIQFGKQIHYYEVKLSKLMFCMHTQGGMYTIQILCMCCIVSMSVQLLFSFLYVLSTNTNKAVFTRFLCQCNSIRGYPSRT